MMDERTEADKEFENAVAKEGPFTTYHVKQIARLIKEVGEVEFEMIGQICPQLVEIAVHVDQLKIQLQATNIMVAQPIQN